MGSLPEARTRVIHGASCVFLAVAAAASQPQKNNPPNYLTSVNTNSDIKKEGADRETHL